jgi:16S rRNA (adenine1518-N6/adenine1519-N6)-dimethyltransferase
MLGCHMQVQPLFDVPPEAFSPPPKVVSTVVALRPLPASTYRIADSKSLSTLVAKAFSQRRKTVRNALKSVVNDEMLAGAGIDPSARPEQIPIDNWVQLANAFVSST